MNGGHTMPTGTAFGWSHWQFSPEDASVWSYLRRLVTRESLSLTKVLETLRVWNGCDAVMLIARDNEQPLDQGPAWVLRELTSGGGPDADVFWRGLCKSRAFWRLLDDLSDRAQAGHGGDPRAFVDFQPQVIPAAPGDEQAAQFLQQYRCAKGLNDLDPALGPVTAFPLGHIRLGERSLGETLFLMANQVTARGGEQYDGRGFVVPKHSFVALCVYLAEVNAHFWRKERVDSLALSARRKQLEADPVLQGAYLRSACRLAPLLDEADLGPTVETLVEIQRIEPPAVGHAPDPSPPEAGEEAGEPFTVDRAREALNDCYYCCRDNSPLEPIATEEQGRRRRRVQAIWQWAKHLSKVQERREKVRNGRGDYDHGEAEEAVKELAGEGKKLLGELPGVLWADGGEDLELSAPRLAAFFLTQLLAWRERHDAAGKCALGGAVEGVGVRQRLVCLLRLAVVAQFALGAREPDVDTLHALLWSVCEFGHAALGLDRRIDLEHHLGLAAMEQPALYGLKRFYRDHLNHVIQVCLTGWLLMETQFGDPPKRLWMHVAEKMRLSGWDELGAWRHVLAQWFLAALLHDVGYVIEVGKGWTELLKRFQSKSLTRLHEDVQKHLGELSSVATGITEWEYQTDDRPGEDHGVISAIHVRERLADLGRKRSVGEFSHAIAAMAHHNHFSRKIPFDGEPLGVILVLADELQEWDRPWMDLDRVPLALSAMPVSRGAGQSSWCEPLASVKGNIRLECDSDHRLSLCCTAGALEFRLDYAREVHRHDGIFMAWLGRSATLQRLDLEGMPCEVRYVMRSDVRPPEDLPRRRPDEPQMERLRRLVHEKRVWQVEPWLPGEHPPAPPGPAAVEYRCHEGHEDVILNVRSLFRERPIVERIDEFWKAHRDWAESRESQEPSL